MQNLLDIGDNAFTTAYAVPYAQQIKKFSLRRQLAFFTEKLFKDASTVTSDFQALISESENFFRNFQSISQPTQLIDQCSYFNSLFSSEIDSHKQYAERRTGFDNIRRGATSNTLKEILKDVSKRHGVKLIELQDENIDDLLRFLKPLCVNRDRAPIVCVDYLQIIPPSNDRRLITDKMKIDDIVRKLKTFQRETNTTFIVISSFNRLNYYQQVSFESFKDSGNIEYSAVVVWGLQLDVVNSIRIGDLVSDTRKKF